MMDQIVRDHSFKRLGAPVNTTALATSKIGVKMAGYSFSVITTLMIVGMAWFVSKERMKIDCLYREGNGQRYTIIDEVEKKKSKWFFTKYITPE